jgi:hypothetical protein
VSAARKQVGTAGDVAAGFLDQEADSPPKKSSWLDKLGGFLEDAGAHVVNGLASFRQRDGAPPWRDRFARRRPSAD